ncbi:hypothetical protein [Lacihabitans soyangensis]|uniref:DUF4252 domain-containing protein n=1 Tax=Lacihabitans soyangensis TaxID=869394 RepID=A0AAE3GZN0_9BACT|nr:hypothetical protein [Lacihabitans soyangensis]MCP9761585.1 hypothetical protein [Lacihabitans soyangensis]
MKTKLLFVLTALTLCSFTFDKVYVWDKYKLQITVPDDFEVVKNTNEEFEMEGDGMDLAISIFSEKITMEDLEEATVAGAKAIKMTEIDQAHETKINQLEGYYVEGFLDGSRVMFAGLMDPRTKTTLFVAITFADDDENAEEEAFKIINSFKRLR